MNILFISDNQPIPTIGGIERVICNLTNAFSNYGFGVYAAYFNKIDETVNEVFPEEKELCADNFIKELSSFIGRNDIKIVLNCVITKKNIRRTLIQLDALTDQNPGTRFVYCFHNYPGYEQRTLPIWFVITRMLYFQRGWINDFPLLCRSLANKLLPSLTRKLLKKKYQIITEHVDNLVLLSESYKMDLKNIVGMKTVPADWVSIGNALSFPSSIDVNNCNKEKIVLIVSRLEEDQKRISVALSIWTELYYKYDVADWKLVIVGDGKDRTIYEKMVERQKIPNISFEGRQNSLPYYLKSSIFLMTSAYEGFPMTILEAMQCGCPPIAFNTFSAINDLIDDGENGVIIDKGNKERFIEQLYLLMKDNQLRNRMAICGMQSVRQYSVENITRQWYDLFDKLSI